VGQVEFPPAAVIEVRSLAACDVPQLESPRVVEAPPHARSIGRAKAAKSSQKKTVSENHSFTFRWPSLYYCALLS
jgi:hypothetical protein